MRLGKKMQVTARLGRIGPYLLARRRTSMSLLPCRSWLVTLALAVAFLNTARADDKPIRALLVIGGCCHDYAKQKDILAAGIAARANVHVTIAYDPDKTVLHLNPVYENPEWAKGFDVIIHDECTSGVKDLTVIDRILEPHRQGLPAVLLHCGMHSY